MESGMARTSQSMISTFSLSDLSFALQGFDRGARGRPLPICLPLCRDYMVTSPSMCSFQRTQTLHGGMCTMVEGSMLEVLATLIVLALMLAPGLNMLVGALAWGVPGFLVGLVLTIIIAVAAKSS